MAAVMSAYERMEQAQADPEARMLADIDFHTAILKASHNDVLAHFRHAVGSYLRAHAKLGKSASEEGGDAVQRDLDLHRRIASAIVTGKAKSAYALTVEMLNQGRQRVTRSSGDDQNL